MSGRCPSSADSEGPKIYRLAWWQVRRGRTPGKIKTAAKPVAYPSGLSSGRGVRFPSVSTNSVSYIREAALASYAQRSLATEPLALAEFVQLLADPIYYGFGVPRGDGRPVVVLPGLFGNDWYLQPLHLWLARIGYRPVRSSLAVNAGCPERLSRRVERQTDMRLQTQSGPVVLIGHSRGGVLARAIAARLGNEVSHLILLGSPVGAIEKSPSWRTANRNPANSSVAEASNRARSLLDPDCNVPYCGCPFPVDLRSLLSQQTKVVSIYSSNDPVVPAWSCPVPGAHNIEVSGTHTGLVYNSTVYRELADVLT
jgi:triacylglycerol lipase